MEFASDNGSGVAPEIMAALMRAAEGHASGYGNDEITARVIARLREIFEAPQAAIYLVATGTAAPRSATSPGTGSALPRCTPHRWRPTSPSAPARRTFCGWPSASKNARISASWLNAVIVFSSATTPFF